MKNKITYSKEIKIKACKDYESGAFSFANVAQTIGSSRGTIHRWYSKYRSHGFNAFKTSNKKQSYSKEFKL